MRLKMAQKGEIPEAWDFDQKYYRIVFRTERKK
jgi:hypothetical protein